MGFDVQLLATLPMWFVAFLFSLTCHEAAHALAAKLGGDLTAYHGGQVSLDPLPHIKRHPFGTIAVPIISFFLNGGTWMLGWGSAPMDPFWAARHPRRAAWMAAAGPGANFSLVLLSALAIHIGLLGGWLSAPNYPSSSQIVVLADGSTTVMTMFVSVMFTLNLLLGTFNLMPAPPLDGHGVVGLFLSDDLARKWRDLTAEPMAQMVGFVVAYSLYGKLWGPIFRGALNALYPGQTYVAS
jgi:Zn-dependent protease